MRERGGSSPSPGTKLSVNNRKVKNTCEIFKSQASRPGFFFDYGTERIFLILSSPYFSGMKFLLVADRRHEQSFRSLINLASADAQVDGGVSVESNSAKANCSKVSEYVSTCRVEINRHLKNVTECAIKRKVRPGIGEYDEYTGYFSIKEEVLEHVWLEDSNGILPGSFTKETRVLRSDVVGSLFYQKKSAHSECMQKRLKYSDHVSLGKAKKSEEG